MPRVRSSRRVAGLKPTDYDHEISIVDHDGTPDRGAGATHAVNTNTEPRSSTEDRLLDSADGQTRLASQSYSSSLAHESNYSSGLPEPPSEGPDRAHDLPHPALQPSIEVQAPTPGPLHRDPLVVPHRPKVARETAVDILYENERGCFFCGRPMFSSRLLGGLDPPTWTNAYHKPSPTDIHTSQVPDPTWEWAGAEWQVNHQEGVDEGGWEYSFAFSKLFNWHGPNWSNSFVRRRAWVRKRVRKRPEDVSADPHMLNGDYFSIRPVSARSNQASHKSTASMASIATSSMSGVSSAEMDQAPSHIEDLDTLLEVLRGARIDREKLEAAKNYLENAHDLERLNEGVHEIMSIFVFQASRRLLLSHLATLYEDTNKALAGGETPELQARHKSLQASLRHAEEEVAKLAYWSDIKDMAESRGARPVFDKGEEGPADWEGLDRSGPAGPNGERLPGP